MDVGLAVADLPVLPRNERGGTGGDSGSGARGDSSAGVLRRGGAGVQSDGDSHARGDNGADPRGNSNNDPRGDRCGDTEAALPDDNSAVGLASARQSQHGHRYDDRQDEGHEGSNDVGSDGQAGARSDASQQKTAGAYPQLVADGLLEASYRDELPHLLRRECAEVLDFHLQQLASHEARCRLVLGRLAQLLLGQRLHRHIGFVRLSDYSRERLGLSARQLQSLAQVTQWLSTRPELGRAFKTGEISWSELRRRVVADKTSDEARVDTAAGAAPSDAATSADDSDDLIEGEPAVEFHLSCPPSLRLLWRRAVELAARAAGSSLSYWQAAELIAAEALGGTAAEEPPASSMANRESDSADGVTGDLAVAPQAPSGPAPESVSAGDPPCITEEQQRGGDADESFGLDEQLLPQPPPKSAFPDTRLPSDLLRLTRGLSTISPHELDARLRHVVRAMQSLDWQTGCLLRTLFSLHLHREIGFASSSLYIRSRLQISVRKARGLVAIERATLLHCSELSRAYRDGKISWLRALAILPVLSEDSGHLWVERAARVTLRRLHDEVTWALNRADASNGRSGLRPPPLGASIDTLDSDLAVATDPADHSGDTDNAGNAGNTDSPDNPSSSESTNEVHSGAHGGNGTSGDTPNDPANPDTPSTAADSESESELHSGAHGGGNYIGYGNGGLSFSSVTIRFFGPLSVVALLHQALERSGRPGEPRWRTMERMLRTVMQEWNSQPRHRDPVFDRDGWRCSVPACSSRRNLHDHHIVFRSHGGDNRLSNRIAICAGHHLYGIHRGRLRAKRSENGPPQWQLGVRAGGPPLMELHGDVYLYGAPGETAATIPANLQTQSALAIPETLG